MTIKTFSFQAKHFPRPITFIKALSEAAASRKFAHQYFGALKPCLSDYIISEVSLPPDQGGIK